MGDVYTVAIIGSGPAGLSAAARAAALGLSHVLLEKTDHLSDTIYKYQKGKHVMATPSNLVLRSDIDFEAGKREAILGLWDEQIAGHKVNVKYHAEAKAIRGTGEAIPGSVQQIVNVRPGWVQKASTARGAWPPSRRAEDLTPARASSARSCTA